MRPAIREAVRCTRQRTRDGFQQNTASGGERSKVRVSDTESIRSIKNPWIPHYSFLAPLTGSGLLRYVGKVLVSNRVVAETNSREVAYQQSGCRK